MRRKHVYIFGDDEFNRREIQSIDEAEECDFHSLIDFDDVYEHASEEQAFSVADIYERGIRRIREAEHPPDAIIGHWDFPVSTMRPLFTKAAGLKGPTLESVLKCEHKYWSRVEQRKVAPDHVPGFAAVDPFAEDPLENCPVGYPFWIKPVKSVSSHLGFLVENDDDLDVALERIRDGIGWIAQAFDFIFEKADRPVDIRDIDGSHCVVEEIISDGRQCTQEGYVFDGRAEIYGTVDTIRYPGKSSLGHYEYPSKLPPKVLDRMTEISRIVMTHLGYDNAPFNIEYFWNEETDEIKLLEINARISKSHCPLFRLVDGASHHQVAVETALGRKPDFPHREGPFPHAAKFMLRAFEDGIVRETPDQTTIQRLQSKVPEFRIVNHVDIGDRLSDLDIQDSYSFELADIFFGGRTPAELVDKYRAIIDALEYDIEPADGSGTVENIQQKARATG